MVPEAPIQRSDLLSRKAEIKDFITQSLPYPKMLNSRLFFIRVVGQKEDNFEAKNYYLFSNSIKEDLYNDLKSRHYQKGCSLHGRIIHMKSRIYILGGPRLLFIFNDYHDSVMVNHPIRTKMLKSERRFYIFLE